jgi:hypothetical protein
MNSILRHREGDSTQPGAVQVFRELPSYFVECLTYNCPDDIFRRSTWTAVVKGLLVHIYDGLEGAEPTDANARWIEVNRCFYLFHSDQKWTRKDGREFAQAAWTHLDLANA